MPLSKKYLIEVRPNVWLSKSDPDYYKKWLSFHPEDKEVLFLFGKKLCEDGDVKEGIKYLNQASSLGHYAAKRYLHEHIRPSAVSFPSHNKIKKKDRIASFMFPFLLSTFIYFIFISLFFATGFFLTHKKF